MHHVQMHFINLMELYVVTFVEKGQKVGRIWRFSDPQKLYDILEAAWAPPADHQRLAEGIEKGIGMIELTLTTDQYLRLTGAKRRG